jgi:HSP20 family protein
MTKNRESSKKEEAAVVRPDPFGELDWLRGWSPFRDIPSRLRPFFEEGGPARWSPSLDVSEDDDQFVVTVELPGAKKGDVTVEVHDRQLTIRGEKRSEREEKKEHRRYVERCFGSFSRTFTLPTNADEDHVDATFDKGVLTVEIPKREDVKPRTVAVK